jgi:pyruvate/2-oxoacid:ferredoxin oxidoreductase alpha subunit
MKNDISVLIAGEAGDGILFTGNVLARVLKRHGWETLTCRFFAAYPIYPAFEIWQWLARPGSKKSWKNSHKGTILLF